MRAGWVFVPVACVAGILIGSWRPRAQVRNLTRQLEEARHGAAPRQRADSPEGFDAFTRMVRIPDEAGRKPRFASDKPLFTGAATNAAEVAALPAAEAGAATNAEESASASAEPAEPRRRGRPQRLDPEDLRARIAEAQELWSARVDLARAQWLDRLGMSDEASAQVFDNAVNGMNDRLHALAQELADNDITGHALPEPETAEKKPKPRHYDQVDLEQMSLFATTSDEDVLEELKSLDLTNMTPMEALNTLFGLQKRLQNRWKES